MGNIIATKCKSCGFSNEFRYGGANLVIKLIVQFLQLIRKP